MQAVHAILILLAVSAILRLVARKIKVPDPVLLVLGGLVLAFVPRMPQLNISPDVRPTAEEFRRELRILTRKEERRSRRLVLARWLAPTTLAVVALFATTAMVLTREAEHQRTEAHHERVRASQAQARAVSMHTNLEEEKGRRRVVENEFRNSRLTCGELEQRLIRAEQEIVRQQKAAEEAAVEMCRLRKGKNCEPPSATPVSSVAIDAK